MRGYAAFIVPLIAVAFFGQSALVGRADATGPSLQLTPGHGTADATFAANYNDGTCLSAGTMYFHWDSDTGDLIGNQGGYAYSHSVTSGCSGSALLTPPANAQPGQHLV